MTTEQKMQCRIDWIKSTDGSKTYGLLVNKKNNMAIDCSCPDRAKRGRKQGRACKHMNTYNQAQKVAKVALQVSVPVEEVQKIAEVAAQMKQQKIDAEAQRKAELEAVAKKPTCKKSSVEASMPAMFMNGNARNGWLSGRKGA